MKKILKTLVGLAYAITIIFIVTMSSVPPVSRDAQTHHLALPKIWLTEGFLSTVPDMDFSYYPQLIDMFYYLPIKYGVDIVAKYIHFSFALGTTLLIIFFIRRFIGTVWGLLGGLMFLTLPIILKLSVTVYVDLGLLFFFTASLFSILIWLENTEKIRWLLLAGLCSGLALSTKYNAMLSVVVLTLIFAYYFLKSKHDKKYKNYKLIKYVAIFSFISILVYSPWLIRNYNLTGNPIYPLHNSLFSLTSSVNATEIEPNFKDITVQPLTLRKILYHESLPHILALPFRIFFEGQDDNPQYFDGKLNPLLLIFPLFLLLARKMYWQNKFLVSFIVISLLYTMLATGMRIRYIITIVSPVIVLTIFGLYRLNKWLKGHYSKISNRLVISVLLIFYFIFNMNYGLKLFKKIDPIPYLSGKISRNEYIVNNLPYYSLNQEANNIVPPGGKLLAVYTGNRRYYLNVPLSLESTLLFALAGQVSDISELVDTLSKRRITHILVRLDLFKQELSRRDSNTQQIIVGFFKRYAKIISSKDVFALYQIL